MKKIYFASDFHLGVGGKCSSAEREKQLIRWLESIKGDAGAIYLVGDVFDFWFEYRTVVPKGYVRLLGKLAEIRDQGIEVYFFTGNHDMWVFRYFEEELGIPTYREPIIREYAGKKFYIGHGDGLGPGDYGYKFIKKVFANPTCQWLFGWIHPNIGIRLAEFFSGTSRAAQGNTTPPFLGEESEWLLTYSNEYLDKQHIDFFIFGHRHLAIDYTLKNGSSRYINLGEWLYLNSYAVFDGANISICFFEAEHQAIVKGKTSSVSK